MKEAIKGICFDLDGVLTDTAEYHYLAWKSLSDKLGCKFDREVNERLKGVSRARSLEIILEVNGVSDKFTDEEKLLLADQKNNEYKELIKKITPSDLLPGIKEFIGEAKKAGLKLAVASVSKNAPAVLSSLEITNCFDYVADAAKITKSKPDPEIFSVCARSMNLSPDACIGIEDAGAGIEAIKAAGMFSVGINVTGAVPDLALKSTFELNLGMILEAAVK